MEKRCAHYSLDEIKRIFSKPEALRMSTTALINMSALDLTPVDVVQIIKSLTYRDLYKSMTSFGDHRIWQDVYHVKYANKLLYMKFTVDDEGYFIISLKEK